MILLRKALLLFAPVVLALAPISAPIRAQGLDHPAGAEAKKVDIILPHILPPQLTQ